MTLHWWMHWFWVTLWFFTCVINAVPLLSTIDSISATLSVEEGSSTTQTSSHTPSTRNDYSDSTSRQNFRIPKAIGINPTPSGIADKIKLNPNPQFSKQNAEQGLENNKTNGENDNKNRNSVLKIKNESQSSSSVDGSINFNNNNNNNNNDSNSNNNNNSNSVMKDSKVTWIFTGNKTSDIPVKILDGDQYRRNFSINDDQNNDDLAVLPLGEPTPTRFKLVLNKTNKFIPSNILNGDRIFNKSDDVEISDDLVEPRILATAASILQGISESPRLSRARSAFPSDYQQDQQDKKDEIDFGNATSSAVDIAAVTGSCLATIVLIGTMGSLGFVMYRRRYLNPPQTLNSDKCSNPDSSGYIDDSTIRDNSEEMYSLDNDSFLNSLEAMTIQNYWTDSVKHTKL